MIHKNMASLFNTDNFYYANFSNSSYNLLNKTASICLIWFAYPIFNFISDSWYEPDVIIIIDKRKRKRKENSRMDNLETLVTYGTGHRTKTSNTKNP